MKKQLLFLLGILFLHSTHAQTISRVEYFIDTDPGFGNAINVPVPADSMITNFVFNADISGLTPGLHSMYIRSQDANGKWSVTKNQYLFKFPATLNNNILPSISQLEYFIDSDPGFDNAINVPIPNDSIVNAFSFNIPLSTLSGGLHSIYIRTKDANGIWSLTKNQYIYKFPVQVSNNILPSITKLEYFIDTDPGFGNAIDVPVTNDSVINAYLFNIPISTLSSGLHSLYIRSKDANGIWSTTKNQYLYKFPTQANNNILPSITKLEYFIDNDPEFGNAIDVPVTNDSVINAFLFNIPISTLSSGLHSLYIRSKDANGIWSITQNQYLYKFPTQANNNILPSITKLEYFIDNDPGFGNAIDVPVTSDSMINAFLFNIPISTLSSGLHSLCIRSKDANGIWSQTRNQYLYKFPAQANNNILPSITKLEYFIDTDPGFGNAIDVPFTSDSMINAFLFNIPISPLSSGLHSLYIRSKDANGIWSITQNQYLYKFPTQANNNVLPSVTKLEYFIDTDPGFGNAIDVPVMNDSVINAFLFNIPISTLSSGLHSLCIRSKDANGIWSQTRNQYLYKFPAQANNNILPSITKLEYFIDNDPGFGNAIDLPVTSDSMINAFLFNIPISTLSSGLHSLCIRSKDANGIWSQTRNQYLYKFPAQANNNVLPSITKLEYFIDTDPGFGNAIDVPVMSDSMINAFLFNIPISTLSSGLHSLCIRSKDANGIWSQTRNQYLYKFPPETNNGLSPNIVKAEYFVDTDPGFGNGVNVPLTSDSTISNLSFLVDTTGLNNGLHVLSVRTLDALGKWSLTKNTKFSRDKIKLFIQGFYAGSGTMSPVLLNQGVSSNSAICDTITIELHNPTYPYAIHESVKTLLNTNGTAQCSFTNGIGSYYLVVRHRNSIETWSATPITVGNSTITYDFSTAANKAYGSKQKQVGTGVWAFYSGDINQDDNIDLLDSQLMEDQIELFSYGYQSPDLNGDGNVDLVDLPILEGNISSFIFSSHP